MYYLKANTQSIWFHPFLNYHYFTKKFFRDWKSVKYKNNYNANEIKSQFVWYNPDVFRKDNGPFYSKSIYPTCLWYIKDIFDKEGNTTPLQFGLKEEQHVNTTLLGER